MSAPYVHTPRELPDLRLWLLDRWRDDFADQFKARQAYMHGATTPEGAAPMALNAQEIRACTEWEEIALQQSSLWWVSPEMVDLLVATMAAVPDDVTVADIPAAPAPFGLVVLGKPIVAKDTLPVDGPASRDGNKDGKVLVDAFVWGGSSLALPDGRGGQIHKHTTGDGPGVPGLSVSSYRKITFEQGLTAADMQMAAGFNLFRHAIATEFAPGKGTVTAHTEVNSLDEFDGSDDEHRAMILADVPENEYGTSAYPIGSRAGAHLSGTAWAPLGRSDWPLEDHLIDMPWNMIPSAHDSFIEDRRLITALWTLLEAEGLSSRTVEAPPRQTRRRSERAGVTVPPDVQVVRLRRPRTVRGDEEVLDEEGTKVNWSHRWIVKPHYRWQACGKGRKERKLTFIAPYIKGPEDKPLHVPTVVNAFVR